MDQMELRSGKTLVEINGKKESDNDPEEDVQTMLEGYAVGGVEEKERIPPRRPELVDTNRPQPPPPSAMDISSVRYRPTLAMTSADVTSTRVPSWREPPRSGKFNNIKS